MAVIIFNGVSYDSPEAMPADVRQLYDMALSMTKDSNNDGVPDLMERGSGQTTSSVTFVINGTSASSLDQLSPEARAAYDQAIAPFDTNRNGIPDLFEQAGQQPSVATPPPIVTTPGVSVIGEDRGMPPVAIALLVGALVALVVLALVVGWLLGLR